MGKRSSKVLFQAHNAYPDYEHVSTLPDAVVRELKPIYERLSKPELLDKCLNGLTQNACESLKSQSDMATMPKGQFFCTGLFSCTF